MLSMDTVIHTHNYKLVAVTHLGKGIGLPSSPPHLLNGSLGLNQSSSEEQSQEEDEIQFNIHGDGVNLS